MEQNINREFKKQESGSADRGKNGKNKSNACGPFSMLYAHYHENGFSVIPINGKKPLIRGWTEFCKMTPSIEQMDIWAKLYPNSGIGLCCGLQSQIVGFDLDLDLNDDFQNLIYQAIATYLPHSPCEKVGKKGSTGLFRYAGEISRSLKCGAINVFDILSDGRHTVLPPTVHPETNNPYAWTGSELLDIDKDKLPFLNQDNLKKIEEIVTQLLASGAYSSQQTSHRRNSALVSQAMAAMSKGKDDQTIVSELISFDKTHHKPPLFTDDSDPQMRGHSDLENATRFVVSVRRSFNKKTFGSGTQEEILWQERKPLPSILPSAPPLPEHLIPEPLRAWITDSAKRMSVPLEFIATPLLGAIASVIGRKVGICPKKFDSWLVVVVLWVALIGRPSKKKTPAYEQALKPLQFLEDRAIEEYKKNLHQQEALAEINKAKSEAIKDEIKKVAKTKGKDDLLFGLQADLAACLAENEDVLTEKRYSTNDSTVEKLAVLMNENPNGILLKRDELYGFLKSLNKSGREGDREFYLEAANGKGGFTVDRISRSTIHVPALLIGIIGGIQPGKLQNYVFDAGMGGVGDDGLLQRFNGLIFPDKESFELPYIDAPEDVEAYYNVQNIFEFLDSFIPENLGAQIIGNEKIPAFRFAEDSQELFTQWIINLEDRLKDENLDPLLEAHVGKYRSLMPGLALEFHLIDLAAGDEPGPVSLKATKLAAAWCEYLELHAQKVYSIAINSDVVCAHALIKKIKEGKVCDGDSVRGIYRHHWSRLATQAEVEAALIVLEKHNCVKTSHVKNKEIGPPTEIVRLHPDFIKGGHHESV